MTNQERYAEIAEMLFGTAFARATASLVQSPVDKTETGVLFDTEECPGAVAAIFLKGNPAPRTIAHEAGHVYHCIQWPDYSKVQPEPILEAAAIYAEAVWLWATMAHCCGSVIHMLQTVLMERTARTKDAKDARTLALTGRYLAWLAPGLEMTQDRGGRLNRERLDSGMALIVRNPSGFRLE